jgi:hypothetical protein
MNLSRIFVGLRERSAPLFGRHPSSTEAPVAQLDRAPDFESGGQGFESLPARQHLAAIRPARFADRFAKSVSAMFSNFAASRVPMKPFE